MVECIRRLPAGSGSASLIHAGANASPIIAVTQGAVSRCRRASPAPDGTRVYPSTRPLRNVARDEEAAVGEQRPVDAEPGMERDAVDVAQHADVGDDQSTAAFGQQGKGSETVVCQQQS